jgi:hypothetical protein
LAGFLLCVTLHGAKILSTCRNRGWRLSEIIVDDTSQNILPSNQIFCTPISGSDIRGGVFTLRCK